MPSFSVTAAGQKVNLGISGAAQASFTVTNTSTQTLKGRMLTKPSESASPDWFSVVGETVRDFAPDAAERVVVQLQVPPTAPAGSYSFRLDAVSAVDPDEDFTEGPTVAFDVEAQPPPPKKFPWVPWWVIAVAGGVLLLIIIAVVVFLVVRSGEKVATAGNATIPTNQSFDVNSGAVSPPEGADVLWRMVNFSWAMVPAQGSSATLVNMGVVDFDSITARQLSRLAYSTQPIPSTQLINGDVFAVRSDKGNFAKVKVLDLNINLGVQWFTYRRGG